VRRGLAGTLPIAVGLVALLVAVAIAQLARSGQTLDAATRDAGGAACAEAAVAAVEEAAWRLSTALTDPHDPLYWHVRRELVRGHRAYLDLSSDLEPKLLRERIASPDRAPMFRHMKVESFRAVWHVPVRGGATEQLVDFECAVSLALATHRVHRRAVQRRRYGVVHVSPPKPFDQLTLAIADHGFLRALPRLRAGRAAMFFSANALGERYDWIRRAIWDPAAGEPPPPREAAPALSGEAGGDGRVTLAFAPPFLVTRSAPAMPGHIRRALDDVLAERRRTDPTTDASLAALTPEERAWEEWRLVGAHRAGHVRLEVDRQALPDAIHVWPELPATLLRRDAPLPEQVVFSTAAEVDLAEFDYEARLRELERELMPQMESIAARVNDQWVRWMGETPARVGRRELRALADELKRDGTLIRPKIEKMIAELEKLVTHAAAHTRAGFTKDALDAYLTRVTKRLRAFALHLEDQADLKRALEDYPVFNGHLSAAGKYPLVLDAPRRGGKMLFSIRPPDGNLTAPPLAVEALTRRDASADLFVIDAPRVEVNTDRLEAALVTDRLAMRRAGTALVGNLLLRTLAPIGERPPDEELRGTVIWDPLVSSGVVLERKTTADEPEGFALDHLVVTLCPRDMKRAVKR
jgi:hypothetical protein